jgi:hypothetical protein
MLRLSGKILNYLNVKNEKHSFSLEAVFQNKIEGISKAFFGF